MNLTKSEIFTNQLLCKFSTEVHIWEIIATGNRGMLTLASPTQSGLQGHYKHFKTAK